MLPLMFLFFFGFCLLLMIFGLRILGLQGGLLLDYFLGFLNKSKFWMQGRWMDGGWVVVEEGLCLGFLLFFVVFF